MCDLDRISRYTMPVTIYASRSHARVGLGFFVMWSFSSLLFKAFLSNLTRTKVCMLQEQSHASHQTTHAEPRRADCWTAQSKGATSTRASNAHVTTQHDSSGRCCHYDPSGAGTLPTAWPYILHNDSGNSARGRATFFNKVCCSAHTVVQPLPPLCWLAAPAGAGLASRCKLTGMPLRADCADRGRPALRQARTHHRVQHASRSANTGSRASSARGTSCAASLRASLSLPPKPASLDGKRTCEQGVQHNGAQGASCSAGVRASCFPHPQALLGSDVKA